MKACKALGILLLVLGGAAVLAGALTVVLPLIPVKALQDALNALKTLPDGPVSQIISFVMANGWLVLGCGAGTAMLGIVLLIICAKTARNRARRAAEELRNRALEEKSRTAVRHTSTPRTAPASRPPVAASRPETYVSPITPAKPAAEPAAFSQRQNVIPYAAQANVQQTSRTPAAERIAPNPYVRPLFTQSEWEVVEKVPEKKPQNPYVRQEQVDEWKRFAWGTAKDLPARITEYRSANQEPLPVLHSEERKLAAEPSATPASQPEKQKDNQTEAQTAQNEKLDSLMQRMEAVLAELEKKENQPQTSPKLYAEHIQTEWNQPADLTSMQTWNTAEMPMQPSVAETPPRPVQAQQTAFSADAEHETGLSPTWEMQTGMQDDAFYPVETEEEEQPSETSVQPQYMGWHMPVIPTGRLAAEGPEQTRVQDDRTVQPMQMRQPVQPAQPLVEAQESDAQTLWEEKKTLAYEKENVLMYEAQPETFSKVPVEAEQSIEVSNIRSRVGRRAALERDVKSGEAQWEQSASERTDKTTAEKDSTQELLSPASSRIKLNMGRYTGDV